MKQTFFIVGPTATGKSEIAAEVAREIDAEIVSADAFQIYGGLDLLSAKPDPANLADLQTKLRELDPNTRVDLKNRRRVVRAIEICLLSGKRASEQRTGWPVA